MTDMDMLIEATRITELAEQLEAAAAAHAQEALRHGSFGRTELQASYHGMADGYRESAKCVRALLTGGEPC